MSGILMRSDRPPPPSDLAQVATENLRTNGANPVIVARRPRYRFELLTGHLRLTIAQGLGFTTPAVVMGSGETVWITPDGAVHEIHPDNLAAFKHVRTRSRGQAPSR